MWVVLELIWAAQQGEPFWVSRKRERFPYERQRNELGGCDNPSFPGWVQQPSELHLFIYFPIFFLYPFHRRTLWNYGKAIFYPKAAGCHGLQEPYLSPGWFSLTETITGGRGWRKEEGRRNQILHSSSLLSSRNGAIQGVLGCYLWGSSVSWRPGMEYKLLWVVVVGTRWGKEVVYNVSGERFQMKRWLKRSQYVGRWKAAQ